MRNQILEEAEEYKRSFYEKLKVNRETNMAHNREREKVTNYDLINQISFSTMFVIYTQLLKIALLCVYIYIYSYT